jgi:hypothetical protein
MNKHQRISMGGGGLHGETSPADGSIHATPIAQESEG